MEKRYNAAVSLNDLLIKANLGLTDDEMNVPQDVLVSFKIYFEKTPAACESDDIKDTVCYYEISEIIKDYCRKNKFRLLEYMCFQLYKKIAHEAGSAGKVWVKVDKCHPPVESLKGTTSFEYGELLP